jgi:hypothetical protein
MNLPQANLISLLIRIFVHREKLEKATPRQIIGGMTLLSLLCLFGVLNFYLWSNYGSYFTKYANQFKTNLTVFFFVLLPFALIVAGSGYYFFRLLTRLLNKRYSIIFGIGALVWFIIEVIIRTKNV